MDYPQKLINFEIYKDGKILLGVADVELPDLEAITDEMSGAGIAGKVDVPVIGNYSSMTLKLGWNTTTEAAIKLAAPYAHNLQLHGSIQTSDFTTGKYNTKALRVAVQATPKKTAIGKLAVASGMDTSSEFEITYLKISLGNKDVVEIDKYNYICKIDDKDYLESVRRDLGKE